LTIETLKIQLSISLTPKVLAQPKRPSLERQIHSIVRKLGACLGRISQSNVGDKFGIRFGNTVRETANCSQKSTVLFNIKKFFKFLFETQF
jgi:hypothetical protein